MFDQHRPRNFPSDHSSARPGFPVNISSCQLPPEPNSPSSEPETERGISRWSSDTPAPTPIKSNPSHSIASHQGLLGTGLQQALGLHKKISFRRSINSLAGDKIDQDELHRKKLDKNKVTNQVISGPTLLSTSEQQGLAGLKGYETMTLVSRRLEHELGGQSGRDGVPGSGSVGRSSSVRQSTGQKVGSRRSTKRKGDVGPAGMAGGEASGKKGKGVGYRLGTHSEMEEDGFVGNDEGMRTRDVTPTSPSLGTSEAFLGQDMGRGPYLSSPPPSQHHGLHSGQTPSPLPSHRHNPSQNSTARGGGRHDSTVSWVPFDPTEGIKSPVGSFSAAGTSRMGERGGHQAEEILRGSTLCAVYLVSGLPKDVKSWSLADKDTIKGIEPMEDALLCRFRPEVLGRTFGAQRPSDSGVKSPGASMTSLAGDRAESLRGAGSFVSLAETGVGASSSLEAAAGGKLHKIVNKALKYSHPREVEIINSTLAPPTTSHLFTFTIPEEPDSLTTRSLGRNVRAPLASSPLAGNRNQAVSSASNDDTARATTWYGVCLTVWNHADPERAGRLRQVKQKLASSARDILAEDDSTMLAGTTMVSLTFPAQRGSHLSDKSAMRRRPSASETEHNWTDSEREGGRTPRPGMRGSMMSQSLVFSDVDGELANAFQPEGDAMFWIPYSLTLVSKYPIYDCMNDYLKLSWARFSKNVKAHSLQISRILNHPAPRAGDPIKLLTGSSGSARVEINADMPGSVDLRTGLVHVNYRLWPLWQMLGIDNILTCLEVALSNSGRIVFVSKYAEALGLAVKDLKYIVELRGWRGLALPLLHARDITVLVEDPGPYILGINAECRNMVDFLPDMLIVDLDNNHLSSPTMPPGVISPRAVRDKMKRKILESLGSFYVANHSVPSELKLAYPGGKVRASCGNALGYASPSFMGDAVRAPGWWNTTDVMSTLNSILAEKSKKPTFMQRLLNGNTARQSRPTAGEELARRAMRNRALHYVQARDEFEQKVARINKRLIHLVREGEAWKKRFEKFERYADRLGLEAADLKARIESEKKEAKRLSGVVSHTKQENNALHDELKRTERAKEEAMKQLSDMHMSIQELEKERDEVMNAIELQIENVMVNILDDRSELGSATDGLRTPTGVTGDAGHSPSAWKRSSGNRPRRGTVVTFSSQDGHTVRSPSIVQGDVQSLSDARNKRSSILNTNSTSRDPLRRLDHQLTIKSEKMAEKMASIQRKLDLALQAVSEEHVVADEGEQPITKLTLSNKRSRRHMRREHAQPQDTDNVEKAIQSAQVDDTVAISGADGVSDHVQNTSTHSHPNKSASKTIHRVRSNTVLATITTVIKMEEGGEGHHGRRASVDSRIKHGEARSRVSLIPETDGQLDLSIVAGEDDEYLSAGEGDVEDGETATESESSTEDGKKPRVAELRAPMLGPAIS